MFKATVRSQWNGDRVMAQVKENTVAILQKRVTDRLATVTCEEHNQQPTATFSKPVESGDKMTWGADIDACCDKAKAQGKAALADIMAAKDA